MEFCFDLCLNSAKSICTFFFVLFDTIIYLDFIFIKLFSEVHNCKQDKMSSHLSYITCYVNHNFILLLGYVTKNKNIFCERYLLKKKKFIKTKRIIKNKPLFVRQSPFILLSFI